MPPRAPRAARHRAAREGVPRGAAPGSALEDAREALRRRARAGAAHRDRHAAPRGRLRRLPVGGRARLRPPRVRGLRRRASLLRGGALLRRRRGRPAEPRRHGPPAGVRAQGAAARGRDGGPHLGVARRSRPRPAAPPHGARSRRVHRRLDLLDAPQAVRRALRGRPVAVLVAAVGLRGARGERRRLGDEARRAGSPEPLLLPGRRPRALRAVRLQPGHGDPGPVRARRAPRA